MTDEYFMFWAVIPTFLCAFECACMRVCVRARLCVYKFECRPQYVLARLQDIGRFLTLPLLWPRTKQAVNCVACKYTKVFHHITSHRIVDGTYGGQSVCQSTEKFTLPAGYFMYLFIYYVLQVWDEAAFSCRCTNPAFSSESLKTSCECNLCRLQISSQWT